MSAILLLPPGTHTEASLSVLAMFAQCFHFAGMPFELWIVLNVPSSWSALDTLAAI